MNKQNVFGGEMKLTEMIRKNLSQSELMCEKNFYSDLFIRILLDCLLLTKATKENE